MGKKIIATIGTFDGVHRGHQALLQELRQRVSSPEDRTLVFTFAPAPADFLYPERRREHLYPASVSLSLLAGEPIDEVVVLPFDKELASLSAAAFMEQILRDRYGVTDLVLGYDSRFGAGRTLDFAGYEAIGLRLGMRLYQAPSLSLRDRPISSSWIKELLRAGHMAQVAKLLSRPFALYGQVVSGNRIGRTLGYPTANIQPTDTAQALPPAGVYASVVTFLSASHPPAQGMLYIGHRPTIGGGLTRSIEVHLLDFDATIYGEEVSVTILEHLHEEQKFSSLDELRAALVRYEQEVRRYFSIQSS